MTITFNREMAFRWLAWFGGLCLGVAGSRFMDQHNKVGHRPGDLLRHRLVPEIRAVVLSDGKFWIDGNGKMTSTEGKRYWVGDNEDPCLWESESGWWLE